MPELPEVQTIATALSRILKGRRILQIQASLTHLRCPLDLELLNKICRAKSPRRILRRGKYMLWEFGKAKALLVHLGMSGRFKYIHVPTPLGRHEHVRFLLDDGTELRYEDPRRFGMIVPIWESRWQEHPSLVHLGMEPLENLNAQVLWQQAQQHTIPIKQLLLDQTVIAGLGNIYASEALFLAGLPPQLPSARLSLAQWQKLADKIVETLQQAVTAGGTTLRDNGFSDAEGNYGNFQQQLHVYGRKGAPCLVCKTPIQCQVIGGRSSYFCPACQPE